GARGVAAAVNPEEHGPLLPVRRRRRPDVDAQAILTRLSVVPFEHERFFVVRPARAPSFGDVERLRTGEPERHAAAYARPGRRFGRTRVSSDAGGRRRVRNALAR